MSVRKESRRRFIMQTLQKLDEGERSVKWECWQQQPYTAVNVWMLLPHFNDALTGLGFAKVSWPDKWDAEEGQQIALEKAIASIWRQIMNAQIYET